MTNRVIAGIVCLIIAVCPSYASAPASVLDNLTLVHTIANPHGTSDVMRAILMQESNGGRVTVSNSGSYGLMQVQVVAARSVLRHYPSIAQSAFGTKPDAVSNEDLKRKLITDADFNVQVAVKHFNIYLSLCGNNTDKAIAAYRYGIGGVKRFASYSNIPYVKRIHAHMKGIVAEHNSLMNT